MSHCLHILGLFKVPVFSNPGLFGRAFRVCNKFCPHTIVKRIFCIEGVCSFLILESDREAGKSCSVVWLVCRLAGWLAFGRQI